MQGVMLDAAVFMLIIQAQQLHFLYYLHLYFMRNENTFVSNEPCDRQRLSEKHLLSAVK